MGFLASCEKTAPVSQDPPPATNPALAAAQLALARSHLRNNAPLEAIPYLRASLEHQPSAATQTALEQALASAEFKLPVIALRHPFPVLRFKGFGNSLFVAVGGGHPTVIRWDLSGEPSVLAVMFPADGGNITHLNPSPDEKFIIVHRDGLNLLCHAETLKPITALDPFAEGSDPETCQPFSENGLLFANPSTDPNGYQVWSIHDSNTGQILRSETVVNSGLIAAATFEGTTLRLAMTDGSARLIPLTGDIETLRTGLPERKAPALRTDISQTADDTLTISRTIRLTPGEISAISTELLAALTGHRLDPATQTLSEIPVPNRLETLAREMPGRLPETLRLYSAESHITRRLADAFPEKFPELTAPARAHADTIRKVFATGDRDAILAVIDSASHGLPLATALYLSIESNDPDFINRTLDKAENFPPPLAALAKRRAGTETDFGQLRRIQDWHGYESPDFTPLLNRFRKERADTLGSLTLPENPNESDISAFSLRLTDPKTLTTLGKPLVAEKAIAAARSLAENPAHAASAIPLADLAQGLGTHPASRLRVRATALATLSDFKAAHAAWINLITNQPEAAHLPTDYSEAAHTAFETGDPRQAMEILSTGLFRFPNDAPYAIRAGWIALLTGHPGEALACLRKATELGLPPGEIENTTALLAIAHHQLGDPETAGSYLAQLIAISPKWSDPESIGTLPWPEPFLTALAEIISRQPETEPAPSPENDPKDTAPRSGESPIPEPPLPSR